jgi:hypothetical protein
MKPPTQQITKRTQNERKRPSRHTPETLARRLLRIAVYDKRCRIGGTLTVSELAETSEVGDWKMPDFKAASAYAVSQGWLIVVDDTLMLTTAGLAAA